MLTTTGAYILTTLTTGVTRALLISLMAVQALVNMETAINKTMKTIWIRFMSLLLYTGRFYMTISAQLTPRHDQPLQKQGYFIDSVPLC
jgi:hypothetical protein